MSYGTNFRTEPATLTVRRLLVRSPPQARIPTKTKRSVQPPKANTIPYTASAHPAQNLTTQPTRKESAGQQQRTSPNPYHKPNTTHEETTVYVLTLTLTPSIANPMNTLRKNYFPQHLNHIPAHITLFHALPGSHLPLLTSTLSNITSTTRPYHVSTGRAFRMRAGVGVRLGCGAEASEQLRGALRKRWEMLLSRQDNAAAWAPHWTVMNKVVDPGKVDRALASIRMGLEGETLHGTAMGVQLWRYDRGRWVSESEWAFTVRTGRVMEGGEKKAEDGHSKEGRGKQDLGMEG